MVSLKYIFREYSGNQFSFDVAGLFIEESMPEEHA